MKYYSIALGTLFLLFQGLEAQQYPSQTLFSFNKTQYNPAAAGMSGHWCINSNHHRQYRALSDAAEGIYTQTGEELTSHLKNIAPVTTTLGVQAPLGSHGSRGGISLNMISDATAYEQNTYLKAALAGAVSLNTDWSVRGGIEYTMQSKSLRNVFKPQQWPDPKVPVGGTADWHGNIGAGFMLTNTNWHNFYAGFSVMQLKNSEFTFGTVKLQTAPHGFFMAGMQIENFTGNHRLRLDPAIMLMAAKDLTGVVRPTLNLQSSLVIDESYSAGAGLRTTLRGQFDAASIMVGFYPMLNSSSFWQRSLRLGYAYDIPLQRIASMGTHEIQLNICFPHKNKRVCTGGPPNEHGPVHPREMDRPPNKE